MTLFGSLITIVYACKDSGNWAIGVRCGKVSNHFKHRVNFFFIIHILKLAFTLKLDRSRVEK